MSRTREKAAENRPDQDSSASTATRICSAFSSKRHTPVVAQNIFPVSQAPDFILVKRWCRLATLYV